MRMLERGYSPAVESHASPEPKEDPAASSSPSYYDEQLAGHCLRRALLAMKNDQPEGYRDVQMNILEEGTPETGDKLGCLACKNVWTVRLDEQTGKPVTLDNGGCGIVDASIAEAVSKSKY